MNLKYNLKNNDDLRIGTMYCIGRNYALHAKELGNAVPSEPIVFMEPASAYLSNQSEFDMPSFSNSVHHEVELVVVLSKDCYKITKEEAKECIYGVGVGIDFTLRDVQNEAKEKGLPWTKAKAFAGSAPISEIIPYSEIKSDVNNLNIELYLNGNLKQKGNTSEMERSVEELISYLSQIFKLQKGDLIFTGTPSGVGEVKSGDKILAKLIDYTNLEITAK